MNIINFFMGLFFPPRCAFCHEIIRAGEKYNICAKCFLELEYNYKRKCSVCNMPLKAQFGELLCNDCKNNRPNYIKAYSALYYIKNAKSAVLRLKYKKLPDYAKTFAWLINETINRDSQDYKPDIITSVPLSPRKMRKRGYNQAELIARALCKQRNAKYARLLKKIKDGKRQSSLKHKERFLNAKGSYAALSGVNLYQKRVMLVDDVMTTGATLNECAKVLMKAGAFDVRVCTVAISKFQK